MKSETNCMIYSYFSQLIEEIGQFDAKNKDSEVEAKKFKEYKKTSMFKSVVAFEEFLSNLEKSQRQKKLEINGKLSSLPLSYLFL